MVLNKYFFIYIYILYMALALATETMEDNNRLHAENVRLRRELSECQHRFQGELRRQQLLGTAVPMASEVGVPVARPLRRRATARAEPGRGRTRTRRHGRMRRHGRTLHRRMRRHGRTLHRRKGTRKR